MDRNILTTMDYTLVNAGFHAARERIVRETALEIHLDGKNFATAMILAGMEKEFVIGHLFTQGIIHSSNDIASVDLNENVINITLVKDRRNPETAIKVTSDLKVPSKNVFDCVRAILKSEVFSETEAVHSAGLFLDAKEAICITEDLGRHHALDKVVGYGLLNRIDFSRILAASTGRQPLEMVNKCLNAGIPVIATKGVPTTLAVAKASQAGITIAGLVRGETMTVYSCPERIL